MLHAIEISSVLICHLIYLMKGWKWFIEMSHHCCDLVAQNFSLMCICRSFLFKTRNIQPTSHFSRTAASEKGKGWSFNKKNRKASSETRRYEKPGEGRQGGELLHMPEAS